ncbi:hypothetical protein LTR93_011594 [Exophiala xenobiotica]|nr:hypothetical protein LTR93_011594 [Exophiala xenobiotica]
MRLWLDKGVPRDHRGFYAQTTPQYGDWLDPRSPPQLPGHSPTDQHMVANAYLIHITKVAADIAKVVGDVEAGERYAADAARLMEAFRDEYVTPNGRLACDTQAVYVLALLYDLFPSEKHVQNARARLDWMVRWEGFKITTGFAGTPHILSVLAKNGMLNHAYRMLQEQECPSWLYP